MICTGNYTYWARGTPMLTQSLLSAVKKVPNPNKHEIDVGRKTVYDTWMHTTPSRNGYGRPQYVDQFTFYTNTIC